MITKSVSKSAKFLKANEAFVVNRETRERLIAEHPSSAEVLKPFLRGRDVKRWCVQYQDLWIIFTIRGIDINIYPAIYNHLLQYKQRLTPGIPGGRKAGSYQWYEIQDNIAYWQEFEQLKIIYPDIAIRCEFAFDTNTLYPDCTLFLIPSESKYLLGFLNFGIVQFFINQICPTVRGNFRRFKSIYVSQIPIPATSNPKPIETLVNKIITVKSANHNANVSEIEAEIDQLVYQLYGLTPEEIAIVEESTKANK